MTNTYLGLFQYDHFGSSEEKLKKVRNDIFHTDGPGYYVCRNYLTSEFITHMQELWSELPKYFWHEKFISWEHLYSGCPNFENNFKNGSRFFVNFFWNPPVCDPTHAVSLSIAILRNRIEQKAPTADLFGERKKRIGLQSCADKKSRY